MYGKINEREIENKLGKSKYKKPISTSFNKSENIPYTIINSNTNNGVLNSDEVMKSSLGTSIKLKENLTQGESQNYLKRKSLVKGNADINDDFDVNNKKHNKTSYIFLKTKSEIDLHNAKKKNKINQA